MKYIILLFIITNLFSVTLKSSYTTSSREFNASVIDKNIENDFIIYTFDKNRHKKSFSANKLIALFAQHNHALEASSTKLVHVKHISNVNLDSIKEAVRAYYLGYYPNIKISSIEIKTSSFIESLPKEYRLEFKTNAYKYSTATLVLKDSNTKKRYFINYHLNAKVKLFKARNNINRGKILTQIDVLYTYVEFKRLKATPFTFKQKTGIRTRKRFREGNIIYAKDVEISPAVLKGKSVLVRLINGSLQLEFQAKALQDAYIGEEIYVEKRDKKRLRVKVTGKNQVEIE